VKRTLGLCALVAGALLSAGGLAAQSDNSGFMLNLHLAGNAIQYTGLDADEDPESGGGLGLALGYGFNDRIILFFNVDAATVEYDEEVSGSAEDDTYDALTGDLGVRVNFGNEGMKLRPYINAAFTGVAIMEKGEALPGDEVETTLSGGGITIGGGLQYFFSRTLALDVGLQATQGAFTTFTVDNDDEELETGIAFGTSRLQLGVTWHP
jgi:opacity protein-like surface antigen